MFTPVSRALTIVWGVCSVKFFAYRRFVAYDTYEIGGTILYRLGLLIMTSIPILAFLGKAVSVSKPVF